ncbi:sigma-70 family RNA polymerase sigma factor [Actinoplanes sp. NPDC051411]|uniref:sigma-70 family RNA polymerase sigma factor n=1 Tax=Actinoplanes sp. NPDC051411 TaxID=3155522 RepID=UPI00342F0E96
MSELELLAERFERDRPHLRTVAQRILGSPHEADDAVQEAWVRLSRSDTSEVGNLTGWLTTVVSRVCLDMLRARSARPEEPADLLGGDPLHGGGPVHGGGPDRPETDPEHSAMMADAIGPALMLVLDTLGPAERLAFVLHDMFAVPFPEIATIVGCSPAAARQLASRARRRVQGSDLPDRSDKSERHAIVSAFLAAAHGGDFAALLEMLDPDVVMRADQQSVRMGADAVLTGAAAVAGRFQGAAGAQVAVLDGRPGLVWTLNGKVMVVFEFSFDADGRITGVEQRADRAVLGDMTIEIVD